MVAVVQGNEQRESTLLHSKLQWKGGLGRQWARGRGRGLGYGGHTTRLVCPTNSTLYQLPFDFGFSRDQGGREEEAAGVTLLASTPSLAPLLPLPYYNWTPLAREKRESEQVAVVCSSLATLFGCRTSAPVARHKAYLLNSACKTSLPTWPAPATTPKKTPSPPSLY
jgi:hypothetical protein